MKNKQLKKNYEKHIRVNISLPPHLHQQADVAVRKFGFSGLSDYFQGRLRKDLGLELPA